MLDKENRASESVENTGIFRWSWREEMNIEKTEKHSHMTKDGPSKEELYTAKVLLPGHGPLSPTVYNRDPCQAAASALLVIPSNPSCSG